MRDVFFSHEVRSESACGVDKGFCCLWSPGETLAVSDELLGAPPAQRAIGVDQRTLGASVVTHAEAPNKVSISTVSEVLASCRPTDARPLLMAKSAPSSRNSAWRDHIDPSMLVTLQSALEA